MHKERPVLRLSDGGCDSDSDETEYDSDGDITYPFFEEIINVQYEIREIIREELEKAWFDTRREVEKLWNEMMLTIIPVFRRWRLSQESYETVFELELGEKTHFTHCGESVILQLNFLYIIVFCFFFS
jgi:hypothetical protein